MIIDIFLKLTENIYLSLLVIIIGIVSLIYLLKNIINMTSFMDVSKDDKYIITTYKFDTVLGLKFMLIGLLLAVIINGMVAVYLY